MRLAFHSRKKVGCLNSPHSHHQRADSNVLPGTGSPARERHAKTRWPFIALGRPFLYLPRHHSQCVADIIGACRPLSASQPAFREGAKPSHSGSWAPISTSRCLETQPYLGVAWKEHSRGPDGPGSRSRLCHSRSRLCRSDDLGKFLNLIMCPVLIIVGE